MSDRHAADHELEIGTSVGRYVLLRPLRARRRTRLFVAWDPELDRNVCLELLAMRDDDREYERERILHEAQTLARVSHPNVVVVYDVGSWSDGVYMAMEYVEGESLAEWLRATAPERPPWQAVRDVIVQAGRGLAAAHAAEIVHLAVEPSNIVVGSDGIVRVLDFGLAQRMRPQLSLDTSTDGSVDSGRVPPPVRGSPAYVAPERHRGEAPDARADQFALCVVAWEAFYGRLPFAGESRRELRGNVVRGRIEGPSASDVPAWIESALRRGLATIPDARWPDMPALLDQLSRDPRRSRTRAFAVGGAVVALGGAGWAWHARIAAEQALCRGGEQKLVGIWDAPTREQAKAAIESTGVDYAGATWAAVHTVLDAYATAWIDMYTDACEATRLRGEQSESLLDRRMTCLEARRQELQALVRVFVEADAAVVERAVEAASGLEPIDPCADVERLMARAPVVDPEQRARHEQLATLRAQARALERSGRMEEAGKVGEQALALALELGADPEAALTHLSLASVDEARGDIEAALEHVDEAVWLAERAGADVERLHAVTQLAWTLGHLSADPFAGHTLVRVGLGIVDRLGGDTLPRARLLSHEAVLYIDEGKYREAIELGLQAAEQVQRLDADDAELGVIYNNLAAAHQLLGEADEALRYYERAREVRTRMLGEAHPDVAEILANAASVKHALGRLAEAEADFRRAIQILESGPGPREVFMRNLHNNFAILLQDLGRYDEAVAYYQRAIDGWRAVDPAQPLVGVGLSNIADLELDRGRPDVAERHAAEALALLEATLEPEHRYVANASATLGRAKLANGDAAAALPLLRRGLVVLADSSADEEAGARTRLALAEALVATKGDLAEALGLAVSAETRLHDEKPRARARALVERLQANRP